MKSLRRQMAALKEEHAAVAKAGALELAFSPGGMW